MGFDDRILMLFGIPVLSMIMPILLNLSEFGDEYGYWTHQVPESLIFVAGFWGFYRWLMILVRRRYPTLEQAGRRILIKILIIIGSAPILKGLFSFVAQAILQLCGILDHQLPGHIQALVSIYLPSFLIVSVYEAIYYFIQYKQAIIDRERLETQHVQTELNNLRNQINPHFLFNSLNTLMNLIPTNQEAAMSFLSKLSKFYRYTVNTNDEKLIPLSKEIEYARLYIDLLKERFRDALDVNIDLDDHDDQLILPLSLQLLIENAVKHNVVSKDAPLRVDITFDKSTGELVVSNNVQKKISSTTSTGMGLENIKKRFQFFTTRPIKIIQDIERFQVCLPTITL